ncbi:hypothetical protein [Arenimonas daejeonensis]|uniref:hypothetical protein n=1 Tax=Arenimonas daejeonensis TaxID=370777 RepID=UPI0011BE87A5|nr:hypothetical protein [Arenimonas daejeonensis]
MPSNTARTTPTRSRRTGSRRCRIQVASAGPAVAINRKAAKRCAPASAPSPKSRAAAPVPNAVTSANTAMIAANIRLRPRNHGQLNTGYWR